MSVSRKYDASGPEAEIQERIDRRVEVEREPRRA